MRSVLEDEVRDIRNIRKTVNVCFCIVSGGVVDSSLSKSCWASSTSMGAIAIFRHWNMTKCSETSQMVLLDHQPFDSILQFSDLWHQVTRLVCGDASSNDRSGDTTSSTKGGFGRDINVWNVLVLAEQRKM